jgi:membrane protein
VDKGRDVIVMDIKALYYKYKNSILISFFIGVFVYAYMFINEVSNADQYFYGDYHIAGAWELVLGRFTTHYIDLLSSGMNTTILVSIFSIFAFAVSGAVICEIMELKSKLSVVLAMVMIIVSPKVCATLMCYYCSEAYALGYLLIAVSIYWYKIKERITPLSVICIVLSLGIYQAAIGELAVLSIILVLGYLLSNRDKILKRILYLFVNDIVGMVTYYIILNIILKYNNLKLADYRGIGGFSILNILLNLPSTIIRCYHDFYAYFFESGIIVNSFGIKLWNAIMLSFAIIALIYLSMGINDQIRKIVFFLFVISIPIATGAMIIINSGTNMEVLQTDGYVIVSIVLIKCIFDFLFVLKCNNNLKKIITSIAYVVSIIVISKYIIAGNANITTLNYFNNQAIEIGRRVIKDIEELPYSVDYKLNIIGVPNQGNYTLPEMYMYNIDKYAQYGAIWGGYNSTKLWNMLLLRKLGVQRVSAYGEELDAIVKSNEFINAPNYPERGSIFVIGDNICVKISGIGE